MELTNEVTIETVIANRKIYALTEKYCIAECIIESPEPYVVWHIDEDRKGVWGGQYFEDRLDAEWEFCLEAFKDFFEDYEKCQMIGNANAKKSQNKAVKKNEKEMSHIEFLKWALEIFKFFKWILRKQIKKKPNHAEQHT